MLKKVLLGAMVLCLLFSNALVADNAVKLPEIKFSGLLEVDLYYLNNDKAADESKVEVSDAQLNVDAKLADKLNANIVIYWDNSYGANNVDFDEAKLDWTINEKAALRAGKFYMPFGYASTNLVSSPRMEILSSQYGSFNAVQFDYKVMNELVLKAAVFNAEVQLNDQSNDFFRDAVIAGEYSKNNLTLGLSFISNVAELYNQYAAATFITANTKNRGVGMDIYANYKINKLSLTGEYLDSIREPKTDRLGTGITKYDVNSLNLEAGYEYSEKIGFGARYEYAKAEAGAADVLKEQNYAVGCNYNVYTNTVLKFEYMHTKSDVAANPDSNRITARVSYSF